MSHDIAVFLYCAAGLLIVILAFRLALPLFLVLYAAPIPGPRLGTTKIACVGDSITYGALVRNRRQNCYPARLGELLGENFSVRNFGANARAAQREADLAYWKHKYFQLSCDLAPDIVLIMLGTNDSRKPNWKSLHRYLQDYRALLMHYRSLPSQPIVYALTPPTAFRLKGKKAVKYGMSQQALNEMTGGIRKLASELNIGMIDINAATASHPEYFPSDGIHANADGARFIAETVYSALKDSSCAALASRLTPQKAPATG